VEETLQEKKTRLKEGDEWLKNRDEEWFQDNLGMTRYEVCVMLDLLELQIKEEENGAS
jgi:hypothetical protein